MTEPLSSKPMRYRIQQDKGEYCLKGCADGDLMDYAEHAAIVERLTRERDEAQKILAAERHAGNVIDNGLLNELQKVQAERDRLRAALDSVGKCKDLTCPACRERIRQCSPDSAGESRG